MIYLIHLHENFPNKIHKLFTHVLHYLFCPLIKTDISTEYSKKTLWTFGTSSTMILLVKHNSLDIDITWLCVITCCWLVKDWIIREEGTLLTTKITTKIQVISFRVRIRYLVSLWPPLKLDKIIIDIFSLLCWLQFDLCHGSIFTVRIIVFWLWFHFLVTWLKIDCCQCYGWMLSQTWFGSILNFSNMITKIISLRCVTILVSCLSL